CCASPYRMGDTTARGLLSRTPRKDEDSRRRTAHNGSIIACTSGPIIFAIREYVSKLAGFIFPVCGAPDAERILDCSRRTGVDDIGLRSYPLLARRRLQRQWMGALR